MLPDGFPGGWVIWWNTDEIKMFFINHDIFSNEKWMLIDILYPWMLFKVNLHNTIFAYVISETKYYIQNSIYVYLFINQSFNYQ